MLHNESESLDQVNLLRFQVNTAGDGFDVWVEIINKAGETLTTRLAGLADR
jgi:hypothetical protein